MSAIVQQLHAALGNAGAQLPVFVRHDSKLIEVRSLEEAFIPDRAFVIETEPTILKPVIRRLTAHVINPMNEAIEIAVLDDPGAGGACHEYRVSVLTKKGVVVTPVNFQNGPILESGINSNITQEVLLAIAQDRLAKFQAGPYACIENEEALGYVTAALEALHKRTLARVAQGVEGKNAPHTSPSPAETSSSQAGEVVVATPPAKTVSEPAAPVDDQPL